MKINPIRLVGFSDKVIGGVVLFYLFLLYLDVYLYPDKVLLSMSLQPPIYLWMAIACIHEAFKHLQKRIDAIEEKPNGQSYHQALRRERKMKITPIKWVGFLLILFSGALLYNLFRLYQSFEEGHFDMVLPMVLPLLYITTAMSFIYAAFKYLQKRIDTIEEKLNTQNQPKE